VMNVVRLTMEKTAEKLTPAYFASLAIIAAKMVAMPQIKPLPAARLMFTQSRLLPLFVNKGDCSLMIHLPKAFLL